MRRLLTGLILAGLATALTGARASAQDRPPEPPAPPPHEARYEAELTRILGSIATGECPADLMGERILAPCQASIMATAAQFQSLGEMTAITLTQVEVQDTERFETYRVQYGAGVTLSWTIGALRDGRFETLAGRR